MLGAVLNGGSPLVLELEVGAVLLSLLGISWRGGSIISSLRTEQKGVVNDIAEIKKRIEVIQSQEIEHLRSQIATLTTALAVLQARAGVVTPPA